MIGHSKTFALGAVAAALVLTPALAWAADEPQLTPEQKAQLDKDKAILASIHPVKGDVSLLGTGATLHLGADYYYLNAADAKKVLTEGWKNPPDAVSDVIGLVFPAGANFVTSPWGAVITYNNQGYVSDKDAKTTDYNKLLDDMRSNEDQNNADREKQKFDPMHLVGWAQAPSYDPQQHSLVWARDIKIGNQTEDTLNYDVRELGRRGVLSLNIVAGMSDLPTVQKAAQSLAGVATFNQGSRYADYQSGVDKKAEYGIAGLVAAGAGVVLAQKLGLLAIGLLILKKAGIFIVAGLAGLSTRFRNLFKKKTA